MPTTVKYGRYIFHHRQQHANLSVNPGSAVDGVVMDNSGCL